MFNLIVNVYDDNDTKAAVHGNHMSETMFQISGDTAPKIGVIGHVSS